VYNDKQPKTKTLFVSIPITSVAFRTVAKPKDILALRQALGDGLRLKLTLNCDYHKKAF